MAHDLDTFMATMVGHSVPIGSALAESLVQEQYGLTTTAERLTGERDENFRMTATDGAQYVFKVANAAEEPLVTELPTAALLHVERADPGLPCPRVRRDKSGRSQIQFTDNTGLERTARLVTYLPGNPLKSATRSAAQRLNYGRMAARLGRALRTFEHPASRRTLVWDLHSVPKLRALLDDVPAMPQADFIADFIKQFTSDIEPRLTAVRHQFLHNDLNSGNVLVDPTNESVITGIIDFGDSVHTALVADVAVAALAHIKDIATAAEAVSDFVRGYEEIEPLLAPELAILHWLIAARAVITVLIGSWHISRNPQAGHFSTINAELIQSRMELAKWLMAHPYATGTSGTTASGTTALLTRRRRLLSPTYRLFYEEPVHLVRAQGVWMYDAQGRPYLDAYNNVPVVGHCHPDVVAALTRQASTLNTHTRYLTDPPLELAERLLATLPPEMSNVTFTCTGSDANDLATRVAKSATGGTGFIVTDFAYHGTTEIMAGMSPAACIEMAPNVFTVPAPIGPQRAAEFGANVESCLARMKAAGIQAAALLVDTLFSSDGIASHPRGFLAPAVKAIHDAGGLFIADEVQPGFGRTGDTLWGFQRHEVLPDLITMGKPMGNGHPIAAMVARDGVITEFANRTRYFNTFGGNSVACAVGLAVLDVIQREKLLDNARETGAYLQAGLRKLASRHPWIKEIRGAGLFLGVEIGAHPDTGLDPRQETTRIVNRMRQEGVLIGATGRNGNALKIRPPLPFARAEADLLLEKLDLVLSA